MQIALLLSTFVSIIFSIVGAIKGFGAPASAGNVNGTVSVLDTHPAAKTIAATAPVVIQQRPATVKNIVSDTVNQPWTVWGLGALALFSVPLISQLRAGAHEAAGSARSVYDEANKAADRVNNADNYTQNKSRRLRK